ncbi:MAG TPA: histidine kinase [Chitinophagaceae bacterium]|nr:histidine kinase [Chitinophagaceae bacterium]
MDAFKPVEVLTSPIRLRGLSIQQRLPLLICILLLVIMFTFILISYRGLKNEALKTGKERLLSLTSQLSTMFTQTMQSALTATRGSANQKAIKNFLSTGGSAQKDSALLVLQKIRQDSTSVFVELLTTAHQRVLSTGKDSIELKIDFGSLFFLLTDLNNVGIGKIYAIRDSMYYPVVAAVTHNKQTIGYIVRWRWLSTTPQTIEQFSQLMGTRAALYVGNADGSFWTDLVKPVDYYNWDSSQLNKPVEHVKPDGKRFISAAKSIGGTSWLVSVEFSRQLILEPANRFLKRMIIAGIILLIIGIFIAWIMSRNIIQPLNKLTAATSHIADGNYSATGLERKLQRKDEVGKLARAFKVMTEQISEARNKLEQKITETEEMNEQLRSLTAHLQNIREEERMRIAREMHDELGQLLTAFKMDISWLDKKLTGADESLRNKLTDMSKLIDDSVIFVRNLASELRPSMLDDFGLIPALEWHSKEFEKRFNIKVEFQSEIKELKTSSLIATGLFRMYQESLTNVARHAGATKVSAILQVADGQIYFSIHDNGKGFIVTTDNHKKTLGLLGMKERAAMMGGSLEINSSPDKGTSVVIIVPLNSND